MRRNPSKKASHPNGLPGGRSRTVGRVIALALLLPCVGSASRVSAQDQTSTNNAGALFLLFPVGAEAVGRGQAAVALEGHGEAVFWNPAGVGRIPGSEVGVYVGQMAAGTTTALTAFVSPGRIGVLGAAVNFVDYGEEDVNDSLGNTLAHLAPRNLALSATYAGQLSPAFTLGVTYKLVQFLVDCSGDCRTVPTGNGSTHALDLGGQVHVGPGGALHLGFALRNLGFPLQVNNKDQADALPTRFAVGAEYALKLQPADVGDGAQRFDVRVAADVDSPWREAGNPEMRLGVDVGYLQLVRVRGGYSFANEGLHGASVGLGLATGSIGVDVARTFLSGTDLVASNPTFVSFRVSF